MAKDTHTPDDHKGFDIIVNARPHVVDHDQVTFDEVVDIAYPDGGTWSSDQLYSSILQWWRGVRRKEV